MSNQGLSPLGRFFFLLFNGIAYFGERVFLQAGVKHLSVPQVLSGSPTLHLGKHWFDALYPTMAILSSSTKLYGLKVHRTFSGMIIWKEIGSRF